MQLCIPTCRSGSSLVAWWLFAWGFCGCICGDIVAGRGTVSGEGELQESVSSVGIGCGNRSGHRCFHVFAGAYNARRLGNELKDSSRQGRWNEHPSAVHARFVRAYAGGGDPHAERRALFSCGKCECAPSRRGGRFDPGAKRGAANGRTADARVGPGNCRAVGNDLPTQDGDENHRAGAGAEAGGQGSHTFRAWCGEIPASVCATASRCWRTLSEAANCAHSWASKTNERRFRGTARYVPPSANMSRSTSS